ncbi:MAG: heat shock protein HslJ [Psychromonas sp.]|jgi:heat shock protein HslJ|uniref:META domain-containing protein n=1 Tax=Psychromonas sp. TaxID=1884585 RepID=UPI0039E6ECC6
MKFINKKPFFLTALFLFACSAETANTIEPEKKTIELAQIQQQWVLVAIDKQAVNTKITSTLTIAAGAKATGNLACNHFFGTLELKDNRLRIDKMASTRKMCQGELNDIELVVSSILGDWSAVSLSGNKLTLLGAAHSLNYTIQQ